VLAGFACKFNNNPVTGIETDKTEDIGNTGWLMWLK
jgi:hypothetical protein